MFTNNHLHKKSTLTKTKCVIFENYFALITPSEMQAQLGSVRFKVELFCEDKVLI